MDTPFFIMLWNQNHTNAMPILRGGDDEDLEEVAMYATEDEARAVAESHTYCKEFGYEIFEMGTGA